MRLKGALNGNRPYQPHSDRGCSAPLFAAGIFLFGIEEFIATLTG